MNTIVMKVQTLPCEQGMSHSHITNRLIMDGETHESPYNNCVYDLTIDHYDTLEQMITFTEAQANALGYDFKLKQVS